MSDNIEIFLFRAHGWESVKPTTRAEHAAKLLVSRLAAVERAVTQLKSARQSEENIGQTARVCAFNVAIQTVENAIRSKAATGGQ